MLNQKGFTLLEMIIVLVIMATLTVFSTQSLQQAIKNKVKLQTQIDDMAQMRDTLKVMERDINLAFHYTDLEKELKELIKKKRVEGAKVTTTTVAGQAPPLPIPPYNPNDPNDPLNQNSESRVDPTTHFIGTDTQMHFATFNTSRLTEGMQMADFIKVGYVLQSCRKPGRESSGNCLVRKTSNLVEGDPTKTDESVALLTDVTEFKLRYIGKGKQDWVSSWDTAQGDAVAKGRFPDAVEVSLTVEKGPGEKKKKISMQIVVPIRFTNNTATDNANAEAQRQSQNPGALPGNFPIGTPGGGR